MGVSFNELAERELNDAAQYYELERPGLAPLSSRKCSVAPPRSPRIRSPVWPYAEPSVAAFASAFRTGCCIPFMAKRFGFSP